METVDNVSKGKGIFRLSSSTAKYQNNEFIPFAKIISPNELTFQVNINPTKGIDIQLILADLEIHFSAGTLLLISKVATSFSQSIKTNKENEEGTTDAAVHDKDDVELDDLSKIWDPVDNEYGNYAFLHPGKKYCSRFLPCRRVSFD